MTQKKAENENRKKVPTFGGGEKEVKKDLELGEMEKHYGLQETLDYALGLDMENPGADARKRVLPGDAPKDGNGPPE